MKWRLARRAFEGYRRAIGNGATEWDDLTQADRDAWLASITAICEDLADEVRVQVENAGFAIREKLYSR